MIAFGITYSFGLACTELFNSYSDLPNTAQLMRQEDDRESNTNNSEEGNVPIDGQEKLIDCYAEVTNFDFDATKKKSNDQVRNTLVIS